MKVGVQQLTTARTIDGPIQYRDEAETTWDLWNYSGRTRDAFELSELDKTRVRTYVEESVKTIERSRRPPCKPWQLICKMRD